jgi:hypothetical protein
MPDKLLAERKDLKRNKKREKKFRKKKEIDTPILIRLWLSITKKIRRPQQQRRMDLIKILRKVNSKKRRQPRRKKMSKNVPPSFLK